MHNLVITTTHPVEIWLRRSDGGWSVYDLSGRLQHHFDVCPQDGLTSWVLSHSKVKRRQRAH